MFQLFVNWNSEEMIMADKLIENLASKIVIDHKLSELSFGDKEAQREMVARFALHRLLS